MNAVVAENMTTTNPILHEDDRLCIERTVTSKSDATLYYSWRNVQHRDDLRSFVSFNRPIPKKPKKFEHLRQLNASEFQ